MTGRGEIRLSIWRLRLGRKLSLLIASTDHCFPLLNPLAIRAAVAQQSLQRFAGVAFWRCAYCDFKALH
jgi:hypothetical protein